MANHGVYGFIKDSECTPIQGARVHAYFKQVDSGSDPSKWSGEYYTTDNKGYYGIDLADALFNDSNASFKKGTDKIYLAVTYGGTGELDDLTMDSVLFYDYTLGQDDNNELNLNIEPKRTPIITSYSFPDAALLTKHPYTMSESSYADTSWKADGCYSTSISQKLQYDGVDIFDGHQLIDTIYEWDEIDPLEISDNSSNTYSFKEAGDYTLRIIVREKWNTETIVEKEVRVKYNEPEMDFDWIPVETNSWQGSRIKGQEEITFRNQSTSLDDRMTDPYKYKWTITDELQNGTDNTKVYDDVAYGEEPKHKFQSAGTKTITLLAYWNDGFEDHTVEVTKTIEVYAFDIEVDFEWDAEPRNRNQDVQFTPTCTGDTDKILQYDWILEDSYPMTETDLYTFGDAELSLFGEGSENNTKVMDNTYTLVDVDSPVVKFHSLPAKNANLVVTYYNGWVNVTETLDQTVTPVKYEITPEFTIDNTSPQGRDVVVPHTNTSGEYMQDGFDLGYGIDWVLDDEYKICNLDNDTGAVLDNSRAEMDVDKDWVLTHAYQNTDEHTIQLTIRYDDGYQMQTKRITHTVQPIVYEPPVPGLEWDITPKSREEMVTFTNTTEDPSGRYRAVDWTIYDHYNKWNPDSSEYGVAELDNTQTISYDTTADLQPTHYYQDETDELVEMTYYYDDGYCEQTVSTDDVVSKDVHTIEPAIANNTDTVGKMEVEYTNIGTGSIEREEDEKWTWNDVEFGTDADVITVRDDQLVRDVQPFTWQTPSRVPFSAITGGEDIVENKVVELEVRIDTGWRNDTDDHGEGDDNDSDGGQVYWTTSRQFEASPYEVQGTISYNCNKLMHEHGEEVV